MTDKICIFCRNLTEDELKDKYNFNHSYDRACIMEAIKQAKKEDGDETDVSHFLCFEMKLDVK